MIITIYKFILKRRMRKYSTLDFDSKKTPYKNHESYRNKVQQILLENTGKKTFHNCDHDEQGEKPRKKKNKRVRTHEDRKKSLNQKIIVMKKLDDQVNIIINLPKLHHQRKAMHQGNRSTDYELIRNYMNAKEANHDEIKKNRKKYQIESLSKEKEKKKLKKSLKKRNIKQRSAILVKKYENRSMRQRLSSFSQQNEGKQEQHIQQQEKLQLKKVSVCTAPINPLLTVEFKNLPKQLNKGKQEAISSSFRSLQANSKKNILKRHIQSMKKRDKGKSQFEKIDPFHIETYFMKLKRIGDSSPTSKAQQKIYKLPAIPPKQKIPQFIKNYIPEYRQIKIAQLVRLNKFKIIEEEGQNIDRTLYFGEIVNEIKEGKGILIKKNGVIEGIWHQNFCKEGIQFGVNGTYKGSFKQGKRHGKGQFFWGNGEYYSGEWKAGKKHGSGYWKCEKGDSYMGEWNYGQVNGYGVHTTSQGQRYEGQFKNFLKHGYGRQSFPNGDYYQGSYTQGYPSGKSKYVWKNGFTFEGEFEEGFRHGKGHLYRQNDFQFEGLFQNEQITGRGHYKLQNGDEFMGQFLNGKKNGNGTLKLNNQHKIIQGYWIEDELQYQL